MTYRISPMTGWGMAICCFTIISVTMGVPGCSRVQDPWVQDPGRLAKERSRPAEAQKQLRERLAENLRDR